MGSILSRAMGAALLVACSTLVAPAHAAWTLENTNGGDGTLDPIDPINDVPFQQYSWVLTGSDLELDEDVGTLTTITDTALADGPLTFSYFYFTTDESPFYDPAGYFINDQLFQFTDDCGCSPFQYATIELNVHAGDTFGFYINSIDNIGGPAFLFVAPGEVTPAFLSAPEPASWAMMAAGFGLIGATRRRRRTISVAFSRTA